MRRRIAGMALCGAVSSHETLEALAPSLIGMLDTRDGAGAACGSLLAELCVSLPGEGFRDRILSQVLSAASSGVTGSARANALGVISQVMGRATLFHGGSQLRMVPSVARAPSRHGKDGGASSPSSGSPRD